MNVNDRGVNRFIANPRAYNPTINHVVNSNAYNPLKSNLPKNSDVIKNNKIHDFNSNNNNTNEITLQKIIKIKPKPKILRKYMKAQLESIKSDEVLLFET